MVLMILCLSSVNHVVMHGPPCVPPRLKTTPQWLSMKELGQNRVWGYQYLIRYSLVKY